jgi:hypothetical protein
MGIKEMLVGDLVPLHALVAGRLDWDFPPRRVVLRDEDQMLDPIPGEWFVPLKFSEPDGEGTNWWSLWIGHDRRGEPVGAYLRFFRRGVRHPFPVGGWCGEGFDGPLTEVVEGIPVHNHWLYSDAPAWGWLDAPALVEAICAAYSRRSSLAITVDGWRSAVLRLATRRERELPDDLAPLLARNALAMFGWRAARELGSLGDASVWLAPGAVSWAHSRAARPEVALSLPGRLSVEQALVVAETVGGVLVREFGRPFQISVADARPEAGALVWVPVER